METIIEQGGVLTAVDAGIGTISFHHPKSNSLPGKVLRQLAGAITDMGNDAAVKVIVLKSEGEGPFCAGASFDELLQIGDLATGKEFFMGFARVINAIRKCPKFVIGRIQGKAVGGGVGVASTVDYCLAHSSASVKLSELAVGIGPFVVGPAVERKIGASAFHSLAINATEWRSAEWARQCGLYMDTFDNHDALDTAVYELARKLAGSSPDAMRELKRVMWENESHWDELLEKRAEISGTLILGEYARKTLEKLKG